MFKKVYQLEKHLNKLQKRKYKRENFTKHFMKNQKIKE